MRGKIKIKWVNHASYIFQYKNSRIIADPWLFGSSFNDGWDLLVETQFKVEEFKDITHIWFSHEHPATIYDNPERDVPEIKTKTEKYLDDGAEIQATFNADEGIGNSYVVYNYESTNYTGEWITDEMKIEGEEVCDEETGICYAYADATGTSVIPYSEEKTIYYQVLFVDGNKTSSKTEVIQFIGADGGAPPAEENELPIMMIGIGALVLAVVTGFILWARRPSSG